jgi:hypothetical protein
VIRTKSTRKGHSAVTVFAPSIVDALRELADHATKNQLSAFVTMAGSPFDASYRIVAVFTDREIWPTTSGARKQSTERA